MSAGFEEYESLGRRILTFIREGVGSFGELALEVHSFQYRSNFSYRKFCELRGRSDKLDCWSEIPAVPQQAFKVSVLTTFPKERAIREFRTSGTTGEGFGSHYFQDLALYDAAIEAGLGKLPIKKLPRFALTPSPVEAPHSSLSYMMGQMLGNEEKRFYLRGGVLEEARLRSDLAATAGPVLLLGTALAFLNLMERAPRKLPLPRGSRLFETGGYKGSGRSLAKEEFYAQLKDFFDIEVANIINEYGMTELSSQFYSSGLGEVHRSGPWLRHRVVHPLTREEVADGETGILQIFDLANLGSVLAIQTEDLAIRRGGDFLLVGRDPAATLRGCSRSVDDMLNP